MGIISNIIGEPTFENFKLAQGDSGGKQLSSQKSIKPIKPIVNFSDLEMCYKSDAIPFNAINKSTQMIMSEGFKNFIHQKAGVVRKFKEFFENIGDIGNDITFEELLKSIFRDQMIYGNAFVEIIFDDSDTKIVDLAIVDPKRIDYAKTADGRIILDKTGKSIGYTIKLDYGTSAIGDDIPKEYERNIHQEDSSIFILSKRICHFKLYTVGDKFYGVGLLEPAYKSGIYKKNIEKGQANSIYARGFSPMIAYVGNERRMATPSDIKGVLDKIKKLNYQQYDSFPDWVRIESVKLNETSMAKEALKDMRTDQIASLAAPQALVSGSGEATNRATLGDQRELWEFSLRDIVKETMSYFKKYILKPIDKYNSLGGVPDIEWGEIRAENIEINVTNIIKLLTAKNLILSPEMLADLEEELRSLMHIKKSGKKAKIPTQPPSDSTVNTNGKSNDVRSDIQLPTSKNTGKSQTN